MWAHLVAVTFVFREPHPLPFPSRGFISSRPPFFYLGRSSPGAAIRTGSGTGKEKAWISGAGRSSSLSGRKKVSRPWFAFQTRSANDILDDGYRWRKYNAHPSFLRLAQWNSQIALRKTKKKIPALKMIAILGTPQESTLIG
ncbi:uncharacterized protein LOC120664651 isoform X3 [Panicum virgatum]|uniref:uncharacterized protein LOC120664651 isoform X3 n=1 Tax=Panicum virgatum TaxID=38727 RepID=UPI0019D5090D|nr:uncharacterized protein LOC120664651 isoform X3 [Panicum virgatum]